MNLTLQQFLIYQKMMQVQRNPDKVPFDYLEMSPVKALPYLHGYLYQLIVGTGGAHTAIASNELAPQSAILMQLL